MTFLDRIDPELRPFIEARPQIDTTDWPLDVIAKYAREMPVLFPLEQDERIEIDDFELPTSGVQLRVYRHRHLESPQPVFVYYYGGGFFSGSIAQNDTLCQRIALEAGCAVVTVEYRKTPEDPYPAGFDDCYDAFLWAANNPAFDSGRLAIGGVSAGGSMAAAVAQKARDAGGPAIAGQVLIIPGLDHRFETASAQMDVDTRIWHQGLGVKAWDAWLANIDDEIPPYASPAICRDFTGLPPAFVSVEGEDILRDEGIEYAWGLLKADVPTDLHVFAGAFHASFAYIPEAEVSRRHLAAVFAAVKRFTQ